MNLIETVEVLGNFGEFFGAIAVFATLAYLTVQVRHSRRQIDNQIQQTSYDQFSNFLKIVGSSPQVSSLMVKGWRSMADLSEEEETQFFSIFTTGLNSVEHNYRQLSDPENDPDTLMLWNIAIYLLGHPGGLEYWETYRGVYTDEFINWIDTNLKTHPTATA